MATKRSKRFKCPTHWTIAQRLDHYTDKSGGPNACWPWTGARNEKDYGILWWKGKLWRAHRLAWVEANGPIPDGVDVLHECDNPPCRNETHLWLGTNGDNVADMAAKGRGRNGGLKGATHGMAKLTEADVRAIRAATGTKAAIGRRFGVSEGTVYNILGGRSWAHVL